MNPLKSETISDLVVERFLAARNPMLLISGPGRRDPWFDLLLREESLEKLPLESRYRRSSGIMCHEIGSIVNPSI